MVCDIRGSFVNSSNKGASREALVSRGSTSLKNDFVFNSRGLFSLSGGDVNVSVSVICSRATNVSVGARRLVIAR